MQQRRAFVKQETWTAAGSVKISHFTTGRSKPSMEDEVIGTENLNAQSLS